jgi:hypothetical protein
VVGMSESDRQAIITACLPARVMHRQQLGKVSRTYELNHVSEYVNEEQRIKREDALPMHRQWGQRDVEQRERS